MQTDDLTQTSELLKVKLEAALSEQNFKERSTRDLQSELTTELSLKDKRIERLQQQKSES